MAKPAGFQEVQISYAASTGDRTSVNTKLEYPVSEAGAVARRISGVSSTTTDKKRIGKFEKYVPHIAVSVSVNCVVKESVAARIATAQDIDAAKVILAGAAITGAWGDKPPVVSGADLGQTGATYFNPTTGDTITFSSAHNYLSKGETRQSIKVSGTLTRVVTIPAVPASGDVPAQPETQEFLVVTTRMAVSGLTKADAAYRGKVVTDAELTAAINKAFGVLAPFAVKAPVTNPTADTFTNAILDTVTWYDGAVPDAGSIKAP